MHFTTGRNKSLIFSLILAGLLCVYSFPGSSATLAQSNQVEVVYAAIADARVLQSNPNTNYGTITRLNVDSSGEESYIRFTVTGVTGTVESATLRLFAVNGSSDGPGVYATGNSWTETGITWNNRPAPTSGALANVGVVGSRTWVEYDLTAHVNSDGTYDFVLLPDSTDGAAFYSREGNSPPELVLTLN